MEIGIGIDIGVREAVEGGEQFTLPGAFERECDEDVAGAGEERVGVSGGGGGGEEEGDGVVASG